MKQSPGRGLPTHSAHKDFRDSISFRGGLRPGVTQPSAYTGSTEHTEKPHGSEKPFDQKNLTVEAQ